MVVVPDREVRRFFLKWNPNVPHAVQTYHYAVWVLGMASEKKGANTSSEKKIREFIVVVHIFDLCLGRLLNRYVDTFCLRFLLFLLVSTSGG